MLQILLIIGVYIAIVLFCVLLIWLSSVLYYLVAKKKDNKLNNPKNLAILAVYAVLVLMASLAFLSFNFYFYLVVSFLLLGEGFYLILKKVLRANRLDSIILALIWAVILCPGWLKFLGLV